MDLMNGSTVNFTTPDTSANLTTPALLNVFVLSFHFIFGLLIHSYVIWIIIRGTACGLAMELFNLNLSIFENVLSLNSLFILLVDKFPKLIIISRFLVGLAITGRPLFHCLICVERYLAVVHPLIFLKFKPLRYRVICSTVVWIITLSSCLFFMLVLVSFSEIANTWFYCLHFIIYFSLQLFCLVAVLRALKQSGPGDRREAQNPVKRRAVYLILITTISLFVTYIPTAIVGFHRILSKISNDGLYVWSQFCYILGGFVQPVLFFHRTEKLSIANLKRHCFCTANLRA